MIAGRDHEGEPRVRVLRLEPVEHHRAESFIANLARDLDPNARAPLQRDEHRRGDDHAVVGSVREQCVREAGLQGAGLGRALVSHVLPPGHDDDDPDTSTLTPTMPYTTAAPPSGSAAGTACAAASDYAPSRRATTVAQIRRDDKWLHRQHSRGSANYQRDRAVRPSTPRHGRPAVSPRGSRKAGSARPRRPRTGVASTSRRPVQQEDVEGVAPVGLRQPLDRPDQQGPDVRGLAIEGAADGIEVGVLERQAVVPGGEDDRQARGAVLRLEQPIDDARGGRERLRARSARTVWRNRPPSPRTARSSSSTSVITPCSTAR